MNLSLTLHLFILLYYHCHLLAEDTVIDYFHKEFQDFQSKRAIPLLNERKGTICGVRVDLSRPIIDEGQRRAIAEKLKYMKINIKYEKPPDPTKEKCEYSTFL